MTTLANILDNHPKDELCVVIPNGTKTTYGQFHDEVERVAEILSASGVKKGRTVSIVLPNGIEFMIVFLAVTRSGAIAAPLNSAYTKDEFKFYMEDTESQLVIIQDDAKIAIDAANELNIEIASVKLNSNEKLEIQKNGTNLTEAKTVDEPSENDIALFLHTSGTTSRPKGVPLTHKNLITSLNNISKTYLLNGDDTALVVMPLFHVHGLIGVALSSLFSGGTIVIPERFSASTFWHDRLEHNATWFSAVPTIHQILLMRANDDNAPSKSFRLIRS